MNIALCDDHLKEMDHIADLITEYMSKKKCNIAYKIDYFDSGQRLLEKITNYNIVFMDVEFDNDKNGIETAKEIHKINEQVAILFVSNSDSRIYMNEGYKSKAFGYLIKPLSKDIFNYEFEIILNEIEKQNKIFFDDRLGDQGINITSIFYIEFLNRKSTVYTNNKAISSYIPLKEWAEILETYGFAMTHKSYIVNLDKIKIMKSDKIILDNDEHILLSRTYKEDVKKKYSSFLRKKL